MKVVITTLNSTYTFLPASRLVYRNDSLLGEYRDFRVGPVGFGEPFDSGLVCRFTITAASWAGIKEGPITTSFVRGVTLV